MSQSVISDSFSSSGANDSLIFGVPLAQDPYNIITQVDNDTVYIRPRMNTTGLVELKVYNII